MQKFLLPFLFIVSFSTKTIAQTATQYLAKSDTLWSMGLYDLALKYAWLAEPLVADSTGRNSKEYGYYVAQYFSMNHEGAGNTDSAAYWYLFGLNMMAAHNDTASEGYGETLSNYGKMLNDLSRYSEALPYEQQGAAIMNHYPDSVNSYLASLNNLAISYNYFGDYTNAAALFQKCLEGIDQHPGTVTQLQKNAVLQNLATVYTKTGDLVNAENYYRKVIDAQKKLRNSLIYYEAKKNLGALYLTLKKKDSAEKIFTELYNDTELIQHNGNNSRDVLASEYVEVINGLAYVKLMKKEPAIAELLCRQAIAISEKLKEPRAVYSSIGSLAHMYKYSGRNKEADSLYEKLFKRPETIDQFTYLYVYLDYCENLVMMKQTQKAAEKIKYLSDTTFTYLYKNFPAMAEEQQMQYMQALNRHRNLLPSALEGRGTANEYNISYVHNRLIQLKGLILTYQQRRLQLLRNSTDTELASLNRKWYSSKEILYKSYSNGKKGANIDSLEEVTKKYDKMIAIKTGVPVENIYDTLTVKISNRLKPGEAAIEFIRYGIADATEKRYGVFIIRRGMPADFVRLCTEKRLQQCFKKESIIGFNTQYQLQNEQQLYNLVWKPIAAYLKNTKTIYYTPDGLLNCLSFDALAPVKDIYLTTEKKFVQLSNLRNLLNTPVQKMEINSASLWGSIDYTIANNRKIKRPIQGKTPGRMGRERGLVTKAGEGELSSLINDEVPAIDSIMKQKKVPVTIYKNRKATEENFNKQAQTFKGILHISSHGFYFTNPVDTFSPHQTFTNNFTALQNPLLRCGLILSGGQYKWRGRSNINNPEDGILTGYEIAMMDLSKVKLIVLSACETALGDIDPGSEGVLGLQRAFKLAGVDKMVLTLWSVNTALTEQFMKEFYQAFLQSKDPADALYKVKKDMAEKKIPPYAWAGFVLVE